MSNANCALTDDPFQFEFWTITKSSPGDSNICVGVVDDERIKPCDASLAPIDSDVISDGNVQEISDDTVQETSDDNIQEPSDPDFDMQVTDESECAAEIGDQISSIHQKELLSVNSRELKVSGDDKRVTGTYTISDEILGYPFREVWKKETDSDNVASVDTFYIFYLPDASGWRVGNKQSYWQSGLDPEGYYYSSKSKQI